MRLWTFAFLTPPYSVTAVCERQLTAPPLNGRLTDKVFMLTVNFSICSTVRPHSYTPSITAVVQAYKLHS